MRGLAYILGVAVLLLVAGDSAPGAGAEAAPPWILAAGNANNLLLVTPARQNQFQFWQRDARGAWRAGGLWQGRPAAVAAWREDLLVLFETGRWGQFNQAGEPRIYPPIAPDWKPVAACEDGLAADAFGWDAAGDPILARFEDGRWTWSRMPADISRRAVLDARIARFGGRLYVVWREETEPLVGEAPGYRVRFAYPDHDRWTVVTSRLQVGSAPLAASNGRQFILLYRKPAAEGAVGSWALAAWSRDDEDWHETAALAGDVPEGPLALASQGAQFFVAVLTSGGPQVAALDDSTGQLEPFAPPALAAAAPKITAEENVVILLGLGLMLLILVAMGLQGRRRGAAAGPALPDPAAGPAPAAVRAPILRRGIACAIDYVIIVFLMMPAILRLAPELGQRLANGQVFDFNSLPPREIAILGIVRMAYLIVYFTAFEAASGQTLGKRLAGIQVVTEEGGRAGLGRIFVRNVLRVIDELPEFYLVGLLSAVWSPRSQRLGDRLGRTRVVLKPRPQSAPRPPQP
jgi:uncharacterized RDD family membrane protein YckC